MKKHACRFMTLTAAVLLAACSQETFDSSPAQEGEATVAFAVEMPAGIQSRAYGDGTTAKTLSYAVYEAGTKTIVAQSDADLPINKRTTVNIQLAIGKSYDVVFWADAYAADAQDCPYKVDFATQQLTVNYQGALANDEKRDAFFAVPKAIKVTRAMAAQTVELKRPFAQVNVATSDLVEAKNTGLGVDQLQTKLVVKQVPTTLSFADGTVSAPEDVTFDLAAKADGKLKVGATNYDYLTMNYLLAGTDKALYECTFSYKDNAIAEESILIQNVPMQRNWQTNIYGNMLTNQVKFNIQIKPQFEGQHEVPVIATVEDLQNALAEGGKWQLGQDLTLNRMLSVAPGKSIDLDLNGKKLTTTLLNLNDPQEGQTHRFANGTLDVTSRKNGVQVLSNKSQVIFENVTIDAKNASNALIIGTNEDKTANGVGNVVTLKNCKIEAKGRDGGGIIVSRKQEVVLENTTIHHNYFGITQNGVNPGSKFTLKNCTIEGTYTAIYLSNHAKGEKNTLTIEGGTFTSVEETPIEVKKTDLIVKNAKMVAKAKAQSYELNGGGSGAIGYGIALVGYLKGQAYGHDNTSETFENVTFDLAAGADAVQIGEYNGTELVEWKK